MATSSAVIDTLSRATGIRHTTMEHTVRLMREAGGDLWPMSGKGGGKSARHVEEHHLSNLVLGIAGEQPSDAPEMATKLGAARWTGEGRAARAAPAHALSARALLALRQDGRSSRDLDLHGMVALVIRTVAESRAAGEAGRRCHWTLWLNPDLGSAAVTWTEGGKEHREQYEPPQPHLFGSGQRLPAAVERLVKIPFALVAAAAELCADTLARRAPERPPSAGERRGSTPSGRTRQGERPPSAPPRRKPGLRQTRGRGASPNK